MKRLFSIIACLGILALCCAPLFFPSDAKAEQPVHATDLQATDTGTNYDALPDGGTATDSAAEAAAQGQATDAQATDPVKEVPLEIDDSGAAPGASFWQVLWAWIKTHSSEFILALLAIVKIITNLTPTEKDNRLSDIIERFFALFFPNLKKGGGTFKP